jgi:hypothetical protein
MSFPQFPPPPRAVTLSVRHSAPRSYLAFVRMHCSDRFDGRRHRAPPAVRDAAAPTTSDVDGAPSQVYAQADGEEERSGA